MPPFRIREAEKFCNFELLLFLESIPNKYHINGNTNAASLYEVENSISTSISFTAIRTQQLCTHFDCVKLNMNMAEAMESECLPNVSLHIRTCVKYIYSKVYLTLM